MISSTNDIASRLMKMRDEKYKAFNCSLIPTVDVGKFIGVRIPDIRRLAKELKKTAVSHEFLQILPHNYHEENCLHAFLICEIADFDKCMEMLERFLPFVDNWAVCDSIRPRCFTKNRDRLIGKIKEWLNSEHVYTVRFAIEMLMVYFLDEAFSPEYPEFVSSAVSDEYYVNMMVSWYFATALAKQYESVIGYIENKRLPEWVHNKTIQKSVESFRISDTSKEYLRTLRIKKEKNNENSI